MNMGILMVWVLVVGLTSAALSAASTVNVTSQKITKSASTAQGVLSLDGTDWLVAPDAKNVGREEKWWQSPRPDAKKIRVPGVMQEALTGYHGVAWYYRSAEFPKNPHKNGRYLLRFWMVDYIADVWVNGKYIGHHEGGEDQFTLDVTDVARPDGANSIAVRVLNPIDTPIDGIVIFETPRRNKTSPRVRALILTMAVLPIPLNL